LTQENPNTTHVARPTARINYYLGLVLVASAIAVAMALAATGEKTPSHFEVSADDPARGPKNARVTIIEFGDFQCPFCRGAEDTLEAIRRKYGDQVRLVYMDFPLRFHVHAMLAASAARCAGEQGKLWQYREALFASRANLRLNDLEAAAQQLGLDTAPFEACLENGRYYGSIKRDIAEGHYLGVAGIPTFFINGRRLAGSAKLESFEKLIDRELASAASQKEEHVDR
jgi:protein-disulfide isomerase